MQVFQQSLKADMVFRGVGVHSGAAAELNLRPAPAGYGIVFIRSDAKGTEHRLPALSRYSCPADLCTMLTAEDGSLLRAEMVEHLMAALAGCGVDNLRIELSGAEVPVLDGSADAYAQAFLSAGLRREPEKRRYLRLLRPVRVKAEKGDGYAEFLPLPAGVAPAQLYDIEIDFTIRAPQAIGRQRLEFALTPQFFAEVLAPARTFGFYADAEKLRASGLARGSSLENSVVLDAAGAVMNPQTLIAPDGFVRHKALDAVGDTALLGAPFIGLFRSYKGGHRLNGAAVAALLADSRAYELTELDGLAQQ